MFRVALLVVPLLAACNQPCADGWGRAADGNCYPICLDGYAPADDTGSGGDSNGGDDTALTPFAGRYSGGFFIDVTESGSGAQDTCLGQLNLVLDPDTTPVLQGDFSCGFNEALSSYPGASGSISGGVDGQGDITGSLVGLNWLEDDFTGRLGDTNIDGNFTGVAEAEGFTFSYTGNFNAQRE